MLMDVKRPCIRLCCRGGLDIKSKLKLNHAITSNELRKISHRYHEMPVLRDPFLTFMYHKLVVAMKRQDGR